MMAFVKAVEAGSFASAANASGTSPQLVAKQVAYLEARLGTRLLHRTTRRQNLTEPGRIYYERCRDVLAAVEDAEALAIELNVRPRGHLRITAPTSFGRHSLVAMITKFLRSHPEITLSLHLTDKLVNLVEDECDVGFRIGATGGSSVTAIQLGTYRLAAYAAPAYLVQYGSPTSLAELGERELLGYTYTSRPMDQRWTFAARDDRIVSIPAEGRLDINDNAALIAAALDGFGVVIAPEDAVAAHIADGTLVRVLSHLNVPERPIYLVHVAGKRISAKVRAFLQAAENHFTVSSQFRR